MWYFWCQNCFGPRYTTLEMHSKIFASWEGDLRYYSLWYEVFEVTHQVSHPLYWHWNKRSLLSWWQVSGYNHSHRSVGIDPDLSPSSGPGSGSSTPLEGKENTHNYLSCIEFVQKNTANDKLMYLFLINYDNNTQGVDHTCHLIPNLQNKINCKNIILGTKWQ